MPLPERAPEFKDVAVIYRQAWGIPAKLRSNEYIGVAPQEVTRLFSSPLRHMTDKLIAYCSVCFLDQDGYQTHRLLRAIHQNTVMSRLDGRYMAHASERFYAKDELKSIYALYHFMLRNTWKLLESCDVTLDLDTPKNKKTYTGNAKDDYKLLEKLAMDGLLYRYGPDNREALARVQKELKVITDLGFLSYFLITHDIIRYGQAKGYYHVGRGSGANSIVAFCLKITDVDPIELDLYFERFINPHRTSPPDFDIDFSWDQRDDIIDYVFKRYGREHVALMATYATFKGASIIRELGKVYGLPKADIDFIGDEPTERGRHHPLAPELFKQGKRLVELPNHLGIHAGGMLITEEPICNFTALQMMPKGFPIVQFDMHVAEENGFYKFDILSQRGLGHIKDTVQLVRQNREVYVDIHRVSDFKNDPKINQQLSTARTIGCFYIESPAMRGLISKLKCDNYVALVTASSIIRPGVAKSGMMREYIQRHNKMPFKYLHPQFADILGETYGVMVYQEDVIKVAHHFAKLDLGEADILRRAMSGKSRGRKEFERIRDKYFKNCKDLGHSDDLAHEVWRQIESFSGYSFCKAHSASFAVESYQSLFLKTYYPLEFMVGVINNFGGFYRTELYVHEARMCGAIIEPPCVNNSLELTTIKGKVIYLGFVHLKSLRSECAATIVRERQKNGAYKDIGDFIRRTKIDKEQLDILVSIRALRFTGMSMYELIWSKYLHIEQPKAVLSNGLLFEEKADLTLPPLDIDELSDYRMEMYYLGFPLCSPFDLLLTDFRGDIMVKDMMQHVGKVVRMVGYYIAQKDVHTVQQKMMHFGTWIDHEGQFLDTVHFPQSIEKYPLRGRGVYILKGKVVEEFGFPSLEVMEMERLELKIGQP